MSFRRFAVAFVLLVSLPFTAQAADPPALYYTATLQGTKIGSMIIRSRRDVWQAKPASRSENTLALDLRVLGAPTQVKSVTTTFSDIKTSRPLFQRSVTGAMGRITDVKVTFAPRSLSYDADIQGTKKRGTLTLKPGDKFLLDLESGGALKPRVGLKLTGKIFVPETLSLMDGESEVMAKETIAINGQTVVAYKVETRSSAGNNTVYVSEAGDALQIDAPLGMKFTRTTKEIALAPPKEGDQPDLARAIAVTATGKVVADPRKTTMARYSVGNVGKNLPPSDSVQSVEYEGDGPARKAVVTIQTLPLPTLPAAPRFPTLEKAPANLRPYLKSTLYTNTQDPAILALVRKVVDKGDDTASAAKHIAAYVTQTMKPDPSIAALRTADDIRRDPRGVCRDYTTFFAAIARAAGIPTKQCVGMAYLNGQFYYHAWPEVWVGSADGGDIWIALEPTWGAPFADAMHLKLAEGEITDVMSVTSDIGRYTVEILEAR